MTRDHDVCTLFGVVDMEARLAGKDSLIVMLTIGFIVMTCLAIYAWTRIREPHTPPCGYGASEVLVREIDGKARVVCGCPLAASRGN